jgi:ATP diphosphatase
MDDIPLALPGTVRAIKLQKRAASVNFDWSNIQDVYDKVQEEIAELREAGVAFQGSNKHVYTPADDNYVQNQAESSEDAVEEELGDLLFTVISLSRHLKVDSETALRRANSKFESRFRYIEMLASQQSKELAVLSEDVLEEWWQIAKKETKNI